MSADADRMIVVVAATYEPAGRLLTFHRRWIRATLLESAPPIVVDLGDSGEALYSPHPDGGWVSPPYETIRSLAESGVKVSRSIEVCECQDKENIDESHLRRFGHDRACPRFVARQPLPTAVHDRGGNVPGRVDRLGGAATGHAASSPADDGDAPPNGLDSRRMEALTYALVGSSSQGEDAVSIGKFLKESNAGPGVDESVVARQLAARKVSVCPRCGAWMQFNNCANCP